MVERLSTAADWLLGANETRDALADPTDTSLPTQAGRAFCDALASDPGNFVGPTVGTLGPAGGAAALGQAGYVCEPYWNGQGTDPPTSEVPFQGGQCEGVLYLARINFESTLVGATFIERTLTGPVQRYDGADTGAGVGGARRFEFTFVDANGTDTAVNDRGVAGTIEPQPLVRIDGMPDDCGNPPAETQPGPNNPGTPFGQPQTRPVGGEPVTFTPQAPDEPATGVPFPTVETPLGPVGINPTGQPASEPPQPSATKGDPTTLGDPSGGVDDNVDDEDANTETIGYEWLIGGVPTGFDAIPGSNPLVFPRVVGNVRLTYITDEGLTIRGEAVTIRSISGYLNRPSDVLKVARCDYNMLPVFGSMTLTPIRSRRLEDGS